MWKVTGTLTALILGCVLPQALQGQDLPEGVWSGTLVQNANRGPREVTYEVQRVPDPHRRWRTSGDVLTIMFIPPGSGLPQPVSEIKLGDDTLSFRIPGFEGLCLLSRRDDGGFEGKCGDAPLRGVITMTPPSVPEE